MKKQSAKLLLLLALFPLAVARAEDKIMQIDEIVLKEKKEIKCKEYIHNLESWKDGKLATMDG